MKFFKGLATFILLIFSLNSHAGLIEISSIDGFSESQKKLFEDAVGFWNSTLIDRKENFDFKMQISATAESKDGPFGILGSARPTVGLRYDGGLYVTEGEMDFDSDDISRLENQDSLLDVIIHEMAHVIGFGTIWGFFDNLYFPGSGEYLGKFALELYREEFDPGASFVPVELDGGPGTENAHWDETWDGESSDSDLLTGYLEGSTTISNTTLAAFADIGYIVKLNDGRIIGVSTPATFTLFLMLGLFLVRRKAL